MNGVNSRSSDRLSDNLIFWFTALTPIWWVTGLQLPLGFALVGFLFLRRLPQSVPSCMLALLWYGAAAAQVLSVMINREDREESLSWTLHAMTSFSVIGWVFLGACLAVGAEGRLSGSRIVRAASIQSGLILLFSGIALLVGLAGYDHYYFVSPVGMLLPKSPIIMQQFTVKLFTHEDFMGDDTIRLCLFFPYATVLGFGALVLGIVGSLDPSRFWRAVALAGAAVGVVLSYSRAAGLASVLVVALWVFWRLSFQLKLALIMLAIIVLNAAVLGGWDPIAAIREFYATLQNARAGSSAARMLIDAESWRHFLESPVWGYGWYSSEVARWLRVPLGSHSTIYGTLYTGGLVTFSVVAAAYLAMVYLSWRCLRIAGGAGLAAASIVAAFGVMSYSENVTAFAPSLVSVFVFLGGVFGTCIPRPAPIIAAPATTPDRLLRRRAY
jgi:hypothetical protein